MPEYKSNPESGRPTTDIPRLTAVRMVQQVLYKQRALDHSITTALPDLEERDRRFVQMLTLTTVRYYGVLSAMLDDLLQTPLLPAQVQTRCMLLCGLAQLFYLKTDAYAAVDTTVNMVKEGAHPRLANMANAVLRRADRERGRLLATYDQPRYLLPEWLWQQLVDAYGAQQAQAIVRAQTGVPPLDLTPFVANCTAMPYTTLPMQQLRLYDAGQIEALPGFDGGSWQVQDWAAALPVKLLGDMAGQTAIDACAAPGGKTVQLAKAGAEVTAIDIQEKRLQRLRDNARRLHCQVETVVADARHYKPEQPVDVVLLDAPCTATGIIRRHPDVAWQKTPDDVRRLVKVQADLLAHCAAWVKPGGLLMYSACSLLPVEGEQQIQAFLSTNSGFTRVSLADRLPEDLQYILTEHGDVRLLPCYFNDLGGMDGFFIACLQRNR